MMHYVINTKQHYVEHEGDEYSCETYVRNVSDLFGKTCFVIVEGAKAKNKLVK